MTTLLLIHGLFGHLNFPELHHGFSAAKTVAPDLIGYGDNRDADTRGIRLEDQADHIINYIEVQCQHPVHLLGHSVGGAVAMFVAHKRPELLSSVISVEGNFTLDDAFWSQKIANTADAEVDDIVNGYMDDPDQWIAGAVNTVSPLASRLAAQWLHNQPASTIKAQAKAVVRATEKASYLKMCLGAMSGLPVALLSGAQSAAGWHVPEWANQLCRCRLNMADTGHLMMVESPRQFAGEVNSAIDFMMVGSS